VIDAPFTIDELLKLNRDLSRENNAVQIYPAFDQEAKGVIK